MNNHKLLLSFLLAAGVGAVLAAWQPADAKFRRYNSNLCRAVRSGTPVSFDQGSAVNENASADLAIVCPVADDSYFQKTEVTGVNVHGYDGQTWGRLRVQACVKYYGWVGSACGPQAQSGADTVNSVTLRPSLSEWGTSNQHHFPYLRAVLPPPDDGRTSKLYGYYLY